MPDDSHRITILGDIGGRADVLRAIIADLGVTGSARLPHNLTVIQVGDIVRLVDPDVHANDECIDITAALVEANPGRWLQLIGNHDLAALGGPRRSSWVPDGGVGSGARRQLAHLWRAGQLGLSVALLTREGRQTLVSHAGLTRHLWQELRADDANAVSRSINHNVGKDPVDIARPGRLAGGPDACLDLIWAEVVFELLTPWLQRGSMPFDQIHGHASPFHWEHGTWWPNTPIEVRQSTSVDHMTRRTTTALPDHHRLASVDWGLTRHTTYRAWPLLTLLGAQVTDRVGLARDS